VPGYGRKKPDGFFWIFLFFWVSHRLGDKTGDYTGDDVEPTLPAVLVEFFKDIFSIPKE